MSPACSSSGESCVQGPAIIAVRLRNLTPRAPGVLSAGSICTRQPPSTPSGRTEAAIQEWSLALRRDPEIPEAYLGRARARIKHRQWDLALADLEQAAAWAHSDPKIEIQIAGDLLPMPGKILSVGCLDSSPWHTGLSATSGRH